ncbi:MAG TPA: protein-glutamate O-methyltransferase CheR [Opitutaceae bacterium]|nr:protein-glutamate O-methyltransferase CheR [Opitutaceae bacterium]
MTQLAFAPVIPAPEGVSVLLRDIVHEHTGVYFENDRLDSLLDKLGERATFHGCRSFLDYYYILKYEERGPEEWLRVMDAFSVQETYFWREESQLEALTAKVVPDWFRRRRDPLRIWSAACASGEEPYSIVLSLLEAGLGDLPIEIVASDASEAALAKARAALYRERSFRALAEPLRQKYFRREPDGWRLDPAVAARVRFRRANLVDGSEIAPLAGASVVFCRNVFIYFSADAIRRTLTQLAARMPPGAHLFVGSSESLLRLTQDFELTETGDAFVYVRKPVPASP